MQTARDVFGYHGRNVLIPKGSRLLKGRGTPERTGETRAVFAWLRILIAGHRAEILPVGLVGDQQVAAASPGRWTSVLERYGTAFLLAGVSGAVRLASAAADPIPAAIASEIVDRGSRSCRKNWATSRRCWSGRWTAPDRQDRPGQAGADPPAPRLAIRKPWKYEMTTTGDER